MTTDPFHLDRFVAAQNDGGTYERALAELQRGRKSSHWMWFMFPQLAGLGSSPMAVHYAIGSLDEARAYLQHPVLGQRLLDCTAAVAEHGELSAEKIFGSVDAMKLRSAMTLFHLAEPGQPLFRTVLDLFFGGELDDATLSRLDQP